MVIVKYIFILVFSIFIFSGCTGDAGDASKASTEVGAIYTVDAQVDEDLPSYIPIDSAEGNFSLRLKDGITISDFGNLNLEYVTYEDGIFTWNIQQSDVGEHTLTLSDGENTQELTLAVLSSIEPPYDLSVSQGTSTDSITLEYSGSFSGYIIYYALDPEDTFALLGTTGYRSYTHILSLDERALSTRYYYKVQGVTYDGLYSQITEAKMGYVSSPIPYNVQASLDQTLDEVEVTWTSIEDSLLYNVYRSQSCEENSFVKLTSQPIRTMNYIDSSVTLGSSYCYEISSVSENNETALSTPSNSLDVVVPTPNNFVVTYNKETQSAEFTWNQIEGDVSYKLYKDDVELSDVNTTTYTLADATQNATYALEVVSSSQTSKKKYFEYEPKPYLYASQGMFNEEIHLVWDAIEGATSYNIEYSLTKSGTFTQIDTTQDTNITITGANLSTLSFDTAYFFRVSASDANATQTRVAMGYIGSVSKQEELNGYSNIIDLEIDSEGNSYILQESGELYKIDTNGTSALLTTKSYATDMALDGSGNIYLLEESLSSDDGKTKYTVYKKDFNSSSFSTINDTIYTARGISADDTGWYTIGHLLNDVTQTTVNAVDNSYGYYYSYYYYNEIDDYYTSNYSYSYDEANGYIYQPIYSGYYYRGPNGEFLTESSVTTTEYDWSYNRVIKNGTALFSVEDLALAEWMQVDKNSNIYIGSYNNIYKYTQTGSQTLLTDSISSPTQIVISDNGDMYVSNNSYIYKINSAGIAEELYYKNYGVNTLSISGERVIFSDYGSVYSLLSGYPQRVLESLSASKDINGVYDSIALSWDRVDGVKNYLLYRADIDGVYKRVQHTSFLDDNVSEDSVYLYKVQAEFYDLNGTNSEINYGFIGTPAPFALDASNGTSADRITLTWYAVDPTGSATYNIYRSTSLDGEYTLIEPNYDSTYYEDTSTLSLNTTYYYKVQAKLFGILSEFSTPDAGFLQPTSPTVTIKGRIDSIDLSWNALSGVESYNIYASDSSSGEYELIATVDTTSYSDTSVEYLDTKYYKVTAVFNGTESVFEQDGAAYISAKAEVAPPSNIQVSQGEYSNKVVITWDVNPNADSLTLYRATSEDGSYSGVLSDNNATSYEDNATDVNVSYYYKLTSTYDGTEGYDSEIKQGYYGEVLSKTTFSSGYSNPYGMAVDSDDNIYVTDTDNDNVYKVTPDGTKTIFSTGYSFPYALAIDSANNLYLTDNNANVVYKITPDGEKTEFSVGYTSLHGVAVDSNDNVYIVDDGYYSSTSTVYRVTTNGTKTEFSSGYASPRAIAVDSSNNLYLTDIDNDMVYKITSDGISTEFSSGYYTPYGIAIDSDNNVYVTDDGYDKVYKVTQEGVKTEYSDGYYSPYGIAIDSSNTVYVADYSYDTVYKLLELKSKVPYNVTLNGNLLTWGEAENVVGYNIYSSTSKESDYTLVDENITTTSYTLSSSSYYFKVAGVKADGSLTDMSSAVYPSVVSPSNVVVNSNVDYVDISWDDTSATSYNIYKEDVNGTYVLLVNVTTTSYTDTSSDVIYGDTLKYKITSVFYDEESTLTSTTEQSETISVAPPSNIQVSQGEYSDKVVISWDINPKADSYTLYRAASETGTYYSVFNDENITSYEDNSTEISVETPYYYKLTSTYSDGSDGYDSDIYLGYYGSFVNREEFSTGYSTPKGVAVDSADNVYVTDSSYDKVYKITPDGTKTDFSTGYYYPYAIAVDSADNMYVTDSSYDKVYKITPDGTKTDFSTGYYYPYGIAIDSADNVYVTDAYYDTVYKITPDGTKIEFSTGYTYPYAIAIDSNDTIYISDISDDVIYKLASDGTKTEFSTGYSNPYFMAVDSNDNLYVSDDDDNVIYKVTPDGIQSEYYYSDGYYPYLNGIAVDSADNIYIADSNNDAIYKLSELKSKVAYSLAQDLADTAVLVWKAATNATGYKVYDVTNSTYLFDTAITTLSYDGINSGDSYYVEAIFADGTTTQSSVFVAQ